MGTPTAKVEDNKVAIGRSGKQEDSGPRRTPRLLYTSCAQLKRTTQSRAVTNHEATAGDTGGRVPVLVEIVEAGTQRQKELAVSILLLLCEESVVYRTMVSREGAIPPLVALTQAGTSQAKQKVESLIEFLRQPISVSSNGGRSSQSVR
ncbi:hypothetical protein BRARA_D01529 [Brassica rapa]|uniref:U-box domain-containing protein n=1 Tax=Brassica campestris TaxID=3711 RepID=A0A397ZPU5_BRACM|nr:hypothetical protein BRARA_D01529 [Brassica rapa]